MIKLYNHQTEIIKKDDKKILLALGTGSGKGLIAIMLAQGKTLVIVPKILKDDRTWERQLEKSERKLDLTVVSKEEFRRDWEKYGRFDTIIVDEAHFFSGISPVFKWVKKQPVPKTSQLFDACLNYIQQTNPERLYLLTATPVRNPLAVFALLVLLGRNPLSQFDRFRARFYVPVNMNHREIYIARKDEDSQNELGLLVQSCGYTGRLSDFADVPPQTHRVVNVSLSKEQVAKLKGLPIDFPDPLVLVGKKHQVEQGVLKGNEFEDSVTFPTGKLDIIEDLYHEFGKVLVFAKYTEQIALIEAHMIQFCPVFTLTGATKDRGEVIALAEKVSNCVVIAQASVSAGYELPSFRCTIYTSQSYSYVDYAQSLGRTLRINNLQKNLYVYLLSGDIDRAVYKALENKGDFQEATYAKII